MTSPNSKANYEKILIAEDSLTQAAQLIYILEGRGYNVLHAVNGTQALEMARQHKPMLIISDILMPEMDGYQLCQSLKEDENLKEIPLILLTALSDPKDVIKGLQCGADNFITKPYDERYLLSRIQFILANRAIRHHEKMGVGIDIYFAGEKYRINSERQQILDLLLSTYETAVLKNCELIQARNELQKLNSRLEDKVKERTAALTEEIAERIRAEKALRESEQKYREFFEYDLTGDAIASADGRIMDCNPAFLQIFGFGSKEESLNTTMIKLYPTPQSCEQFMQQLQKKKQILGVEKEMRRVDGKTIFTIENNIGLFNDKGEMIAVRSYIFDNTERKMLEEQYRQSQKMEAVGRLAGGIAHDFNNLAMAIKGYCDFALKEIPTENPAYQDIEEVKKAADRTASLTHQLLAFSRKQILQPQIVNLNELIAGIGKMLQRLIEENIELVILPDPDLDFIKADRVQVEQIIMNLSVNARDAMPKGGKLSIETANVFLDQSYAQTHYEVQAGPYVMIAVSDNGCGMDKETQSHIFEPFFTTKEQGKGTGLGLATVYGIVKQSKGHIWVYSELGKGTVFKIYFPRIGETEEIEVSEKIIPDTLQGTETILVAEDEEIVRSMVCRSLREYGYTILEAENGMKALEICEQNKDKIRLVLTDVIMPEMNGRELSDLIQTAYPQIKVIFMSGYTENAIVHQGMLDEGIIFLQKPFMPMNLLQKIRAALDAFNPTL
ncbi:MAG: response regulator [Candidatus Omnitrophota bacterium]